MAGRIFDRPDLDQRAGRKALYVSGALTFAMPGKAYEGRLQVYNGIGGLSVQQVDGDTLPSGTSIYIDGSEVVVSWPAYSETAATIPNPGFEAGDVNWEKGPGWSIGTENPPVGLRAARYGENHGDALISNTSRFPVNPGVMITASCQVRQGASSEGNAGAAVQLEWRSSDGALVKTSEGNAVMSASKNRVYPSTVRAIPPANAALVNVAAKGIRNRENKPLFIDQFEWDHHHVTGINSTRVFTLGLMVRDSAGRSYLWRGTIRVSRGEWNGAWETAGISFPTMHGLYDVIWSELFQRYIACGYYNANPNTAIISSQTGFTWSDDLRGSGQYFVTLVEARTLGRVFCYGTSNRVAVSLNGTSWTTQTPNIEQGGNGFYDVAWSDELGVMVAIGNNGIHRSTNGVSDWVTVAANAASTIYCKVIWVRQLGLFVLVNGSIVRTSPDGLVWTVVWNGAGQGKPLNAFYSERDRLLYVIIAPNPLVIRPYISSPDGITFTTYPGNPANDWGSEMTAKSRYSPELEGALLASSNNIAFLFKGPGEVMPAGTSTGGLVQSSCWSPKLGRWVMVNSSAGNANMVSISKTAYNA
ncbi:WD40/YVTN/BNR-like repeat-containing protein [Stenotrophomonas sp. STK17_22]|uniref:WD40/YVTN/BNR-like repeat-containing protein n=1 Tax=Stenotrophomonas sp. STK17_22 TaxID=3455201 RepID=UPI003F7FB4BC